MNIYSKTIIHNTYRAFIDYLKTIKVNETITGIRIVFRPNIKKLFVYYEAKDGTLSLADEVNDFGLTSFKELVTTVHNNMGETSKIVKIKVTMDVIKNG